MQVWFLLLETPEKTLEPNDGYLAFITVNCSRIQSSHMECITICCGWVPGVQQLLYLELQELEKLLQLQVKHEREKQMAAPPLLPGSIVGPHLGFTVLWVVCSAVLFCMLPTGMDNLETQVIAMSQMPECLNLIESLMLWCVLCMWKFGLHMNRNLNACVPNCIWCWTLCYTCLRFNCDLIEAMLVFKVKPAMLVLKWRVP